MSIELKKFRLRNQLWSLLVLNIVIFPMLFVMMHFEQAEGAMLPPLHLLLDVLIKSIFMIWQGALIAMIVVEEYRSKTILLLYSYPLKRKQILQAKISLIMLLIVSFSLITQVLQIGIFTLAARLIPDFAFQMELLSFITVLLTTCLAAIIGLIPLSVGLWMQSPIAPVITAFLMLSMLGGGLVEGLWEQALSLLPMLLAAMVALVIVTGSLYYVTKKDLVI